MFDSVLDHPENSQVKEVLTAQVESALDQIQVIDVREPDEFVGELGHIENAQLIPLGTLAENQNIDFSKTTVFVCRSGGRSARATLWALEQGADKVYNMKGGMLAWNEEGRKITK